MLIVSYFQLQYSTSNNDQLSTTLIYWLMKNSCLGFNWSIVEKYHEYDVGQLPEANVIILQ
ncbi:hypothetical protein T4B_5602 [Trichinella pseudospiralis]|uniref:Uncharacterized protein n=1 Tax=Trichinella pseudospiralis TaxID=6337 RepID=A0A0V1J6D3_TRIPS|nr:hypothetical protein T4B_5602 [Trichinella pseudospiralis]